MEAALTIVYIGDNAGEAVFDTILLKQLAPRSITYVVRGTPILNDVTWDDTLSAGMPQYAQVLSSGCSAPGCLLENCSGEFRRIFDQADRVIAKGQGNYEALSDAPRRTYFLLKAKCSVLAKHLDVPQHSYVLAVS